MFEQLLKRSNWVGIYTMGRFSLERRSFLCHLNELSFHSPLRLETPF